MMNPTLLMYVLTIWMMFASCHVGNERVSIPRWGKYVNVDTLNSLYFYYPKYKTIDFVVGNMPEETDTTIIFCCAAAFTKEKNPHVDTSMISGPYAMGNCYYNGYQSHTSTGCFTYDGNIWEFASDSIEDKIKDVSLNGGIAFCQMSIIPEKIPKADREPLFRIKGIQCYKTANGNIRIRAEKHKYRALCEKDEKLCIVEAITACTFSQFLSSLIKCNFTHALYLDVGWGWSNAWCRTNEGKVYKLHNMFHPFGSNWIVFRK